MASNEAGHSAQFVPTGGGSDELQRALDRLSLALSATGLGVWERDLESNRVTWSDTMHRLFGRTPEQFSGSPDEVLSFVHPDDRVAFRGAYEAAVRGDRDFFEQEFRIILPDGSVRWVHRRGQVRRGEDARARSVLGVALDITERKEAQEVNARLAAIASAVDDAIMGLSPEGIVVAWNPAAERMFGYTAAEMVGRSASILYPKGSEGEFESLYRRLRSGEAAHIESMRVRKDGSVVNIAAVATPIRGGDGRVVGVASVARDVGERKRTEAKLVETLGLLLQTNNQRKLALLAGRMGTFEIDVERGAITWSDELYEQFGIEPGRPIATLDDIEAYIHPEDRQAMRARWGGAASSGEPYESEFRIVRPDGDVRWLYMRAQPLPTGQPMRVYGVSMDVTDRKEREAHIRFLMSEVSHRAKNLLAVVQAIASQTARATDGPVDFATAFGARLKSLASSLDLLVRQDWRGVSAQELVQSQLGHYGEPAGQQVEVSGPEVLLSPMAAQYLGMALHELSTNAVKYGALSVPNGKITIGWSLSGPPDARRLSMSWVESGGPPVSPPTRKGFGHLVTERMVAEALQGQVTLEYPRGGIRWTLDADASATVREAADTPA